jgi:maltooligosyltrehalose trehalohydrolase
VALTGETDGYYADFADPGALPKVLGSTPFFHDGTYSSFRGRAHGRPVDPDVTPGWRFVASLQTHDQVGNRAAGDRIGHGIPAGRAAAGAALLLTSPWTPMLFMGEEFAASTPWQYFTDHEEDWLAEAIRDGRRREFAEHGWAGDVPDPQDEGTLSASTLRWDEVEEGEHARMLDWYRTLLRLRRELPGLRDTPLGQGRVWREPAGSGERVNVVRGDVRVVAFLGGDGSVPLAADGGEVVASFGDVRVDGGSVVMEPDTVVVLRGAA